MKSKKLCTLCVSVFLTIFGIVFIVCSPFIFDYIIRTQFILSPDTTLYESWVELPELLPMDFYLFNWTNPEEINTPGVKPKFQEVGPYRFMMDLKKVNVTWNENGTVTYRQQKFWYFNPAGTKGSLQDKITTLNTPALGAAHTAQFWSFFTRASLSFYLSQLYSNISVTHTVEELLFKGYPDELTKKASTLSFLNLPGVPNWEKFGWFYQRNGTLDDEKTYNIGTGINSTFARVYNWDYRNQTPFYEGHCGKVEGSSGERFNASEDTIKLYMPDICRSLLLDYIGDVDFAGITARKYVVNDRALDNGSKYQENLCFKDDGGFPSGIFNLSTCRYGSPAVMSLPHFYQADPYYVSLVEGLQSYGKKHELSMIVEPRTGIPLQANVKLQLNLHLHSVPTMSLYKEVPNLIFPIMWFSQKGEVPEQKLPMIKVLLNIHLISLYCGIIATSLGTVLLIVFALNIRRNKMAQIVHNLDESIPLNCKQKDYVSSK